MDKLPKVIPVAVFHNREEALAQLSALSLGNIPVAEITFRTPYAAEAISLCRERFPDLCVGAGSVVTPAQAQLALERGAQFIVSPGMSEEVAGLCRARGVFYLPGAVTPTELMRAGALGFSTVKFFPADVFGGAKALKALSAPFPQMKFVPTGGVNEENFAEFLSLPCVEAVGGSWMLKGDIGAHCKRIHDLLRQAGTALWS